MTGAIRIDAPQQAADYAAIKALFTEYAGSLGFSLAYQGFEAEMADFPGKYAPPDGALLLAWLDGAAVGAVAMRRLADDICEMKRLYVKPGLRGVRTGDGRPGNPSIGRALAEGIVAQARASGYRRMRLDTIGGKMEAAISLYRSMGFVAIPPYYQSPIPGTAYMELAL